MYRLTIKTGIVMVTNIIENVNIFEFLDFSKRHQFFSHDFLMIEKTFVNKTVMDRNLLKSFKLFLRLASSSVEKIKNTEIIFF